MGLDMYADGPEFTDPLDFVPDYELWERNQLGLDRDYDDPLDYGHDEAPCDWEDENG